MSFSIIIPSRYGSNRLPGKPLLDIAGKTMIQRVYEQCMKSEAKQVIIATDDQRIVDTCQQFSAEVILTSIDHLSGTDRLHEVVTQKAFPSDHVVVNVQGDEPLIPHDAINQVANNLDRNTSAGISTLCEKIVSANDLFNPNTVKVVRGRGDEAVFFSRAPVPWCRGWPSMDHQDSISISARESLFLNSETRWYRHIGIYAYRVEVLKQFVEWPASHNECSESLEQLRALDNGVKIHCQETLVNIPHGVDTEQDLKKVRELLQ